MFVSVVTPMQCPGCRRQYAVPAAINLGGRNVEVGTVKMYGKPIIADKSVQGRLAQLDLGERCEHGYIDPVLCQNCNAV